MPKSRRLSEVLLELRKVRDDPEMSYHQLWQMAVRGSLPHVEFRNGRWFFATEDLPDILNAIVANVQSKRLVAA